MNPSKFDQFVNLVASVRQQQELFWNHGRSQEQLQKALALETRLDNYLAHCRSLLAANPTYTPEPTAKAFFDLVDRWRTKFKAFFLYKKSKDADPTICREMKKECVDFENTIDDILQRLSSPTTN